MPDDVTTTKAVPDPAAALAEVLRLYRECQDAAAAADAACERLADAGDGTPGRDALRSEAADLIVARSNACWRFTAHLDDLAATPPVAPPEPPRAAQAVDAASDAADASRGTPGGLRGD